MFKLSVPSKTFLIGEYAVLENGKGLVVSTSPRFEVKVQKIKADQNRFVEGLSVQGPSREYLQDHMDLFSSYALQFYDPHQGKGGLGWSSAQFVLLYALKKWIENQEKTPVLQVEDLLQEFYRYSWQGQGLAPSGLDVVSHLHGGIVQAAIPKTYDSGKVVSAVVKDLKVFSHWPFADIEFCLIRTGVKVATHQHLNELTKIRYTDLSVISQLAGESLQTKDEEAFIHSINKYREAMLDQGLVESNSIAVYSLLHQRPEVLAYKGCGALGADVILTITVKELLGEFTQWAQENSFEVLATSRDISKGLIFEKEDIREMSSAGVIE